MAKCACTIQKEGQSYILYRCHECVDSDRDPVNCELDALRAKAMDLEMRLARKIGDHVKCPVCRLAFIPIPVSVAGLEEKKDALRARVVELEVENFELQKRVNFLEYYERNR